MEVLRGLLVTLALPVILISSGGRGSPDDLAIEAARIIEHTPFDARAVADRRITFSLVLKAPPVCSPARPSLRYLVLIDADRSRQTGVVSAPFTELGVDAQVVIRCDLTSRRFVSTLGKILVQPARDSEVGNEIALTTSAGALPSMDFWWIAVAQEGGRYARHPAHGRFNAWRILELWSRE